MKQTSRYWCRDRDEWKTASPGVRIFAVQNTDADGKATGTWIITTHNSSQQDLDVAFSVAPEFGLIKARQHRTVIARGSMTRFRLESS